MDFGIYSLYSNLIDTKVKFCSLCFKIVKEDAACVQDSVILGLDEDDAKCSTSEEVDIQSILKEILGDKTASYLSENDAICDKCTRSAISSYKFIRMCKTNTESMVTAVDLFTTTICDPNTDFGDQKSIFLSMNFHESTCIQYMDTIKFKNNKSALSRFQFLFKPYKVLTDDEGNTKYQCTQCPAFYPKATNARRHFTTKHIEDPDIKKEVRNVNTVPIRDLSPTKIGRSYTKHDNEKTHTVIKDSEGKNRYKCKKCPTVCSHAGSARRHYQLTHDQVKKSTEQSTAKRLRTTEMSKDHISYLNKVSYVEITDFDGTTKYQCTECVTVCSNTSSARRHYERTHMREKEVKQEIIPTNPPTCMVCDEKFVNKYVLTKHILKEHSIETVEDFTGIKTDNEIFNYVYTVVKDNDDCDKYRCKVCGNLYKSYTIVTTHFKKKHLKLCETDQLYICSHCGRECRDQYVLKKHEEHHTLKLTCPTCNKVYKSREFFKQHVCFKSKANLQKNMQCHHCGKNFATKNSLRIHIRYRHDPQAQRYPCQHCPKTFGAFCHWKAHQVKHTRERNFSCDLCGNVFVTKMALVYHTRIHTGERPFDCQYCDQRFLSSSRRADHVKRHHISATATCDICGVSVKAVGLRKHKRRHNNVNSTLYISNEGDSPDIAAMAICDICGVTVKAVEMKKHIRRHNKVGNANKGQGLKTSTKKTSQQQRYVEFDVLSIQD